MNYDEAFTIVCPKSYNNKVAAIRAIRVLTELGLKEAKTVSETTSEQTLYYSGGLPTDPIVRKATIEAEFKVLRIEGCIVGGSVHMVLKELRELATKAIEMHEDELANEILQLVLAEKLRRQHE